MSNLTKRLTSESFFKLKVFTGSLLLFLIISSGHYGWSDDRFSLEAMHSFFSTGTASVTPGGNSITGRDGLSFSRADVGVKLAGAPGFLVGKLLDQYPGMPQRLKPFLLSWANIGAVTTSAVQSAMIVLLAALTLRAWRVTRYWALLLALLVVLGSPVLDISRYFISTTPSVLGIAAVVYGMTHLFQSGNRGRIPPFAGFHWVGFGLFLLLASRVTGVLFLPAIVLGLSLLAKGRVRKWMPGLVLCVGWVCLAVTAKIWYNHHRTGLWLGSGYDDQSTNYFSRSLLAGALSHLLVPRWSILINSPLTLSALPLLAWLFFPVGKQAARLSYQQRRMVALCMTTAVVPAFCLYSVYVVPELYGTRYMAEIIYLLALSGSGFFAHLIRHHRSNTATIAMIAVGAIGVILHFCASLMPFSRIESSAATRVAPETLSALWAFPWSTMPEGVDFYNQFCRFPYPDWLIAIALPGYWMMAAAAVYLSAIFALISAVGRLPGRRGRWSQKLAVAGVALIPVFILIAGSNARRLVFQTAPSIEPSTGRLGLNKASFYRCRGELIGDYEVSFPRSPNQKGHVKSFDAWIQEWSGSGKSPIRIGGADLNGTYWYEIPWEQMPYHTRLHVRSRSRQPLPDTSPRKDDGDPRLFDLHVAFDNGEIHTIPLRTD